MMLPIPYRKQGVRIGDVGIFQSGAFDFLFNICVPASDPINPDVLPEGFTPIYPPLGPTDVRIFEQFGEGSYLVSSSISKLCSESSYVRTSSILSSLTPFRELTFESFASEGAVLTMPEGSESQDLGNIARIREYMAAHGESWVKYINGDCGREAQNGSIRLVIGCDKSTSWGMAAFWNNPENCKARLEFRASRNSARQSSGPAYAWDYSGIADHEVQAGPLGRGNKDLGATLEQPLLNQTLFVRALSLTFDKQLWSKINPGSEVRLGNHSQFPGTTPATFPSTSSNGSHTSGSSSLSSPSSSGSSPAQGSRAVSSSNWSENLDEIDEDRIPQADSGDSDDDFITGELPVSAHSMVKITRVLLTPVPSVHTSPCVRSQRIPIADCESDFIVLVLVRF